MYFIVHKKLGISYTLTPITPICNKPTMFKKLFSPDSPMIK